MQNQNWRFLSKVIAVVVVTLLVVSFTTLAVAQRDSARAIYDRSATIPSNIAGIRTFPAPSAGYNPVTSSDEENAAYGFPPRPDQQTDAVSYAKWLKAMSTAGSAKRWNGELRHTGGYSMPARHAAAPAGAGSGASAGSAGVSTGYYYNWSGFINTNTATKYKQTTSFYYIVSDFNVPAVTQTPGTCDGGYDWEVSWNGIDGDLDGSALLQGGSSSQAFCDSYYGPLEFYYAWIEWYPAYDIIGEFDVNPGDDMFVETWDTTSTQGYVYLYDVTLGIASIYGITSNGGPGLIGNSAEYIVERPCCSSGDFYPLADYVWDFWANSYAYNFTDYKDDKSTPYYPGSTTSSTVQAFMVNDQDSEVISAPTAQGKYGIFFEAENCTVSGGCTP